MNEKTSAFFILFFPPYHPKFYPPPLSLDHSFKIKNCWICYYSGPGVNMSFKFPHVSMS